MSAKAVIEFIARPAITQAQLQAYAEASGDHNPIHLDEVAAKKAGLPGVIAHGMLTAAFIADRALVFMQGRCLRMTGLQTRFKAMTHLGDVISIGGSVKSESDDLVVLDLQVRNQKGEVTTTGVATFRR